MSTASKRTLPYPALGRHEASQYLWDEHGLSYSHGTLSNLAARDEGPPYHRLGRLAIYPVESLDAWAESQLTPPMKLANDLRMSAMNGAHKRRGRLTDSNKRTAHD